MSENTATARRASSKRQASPRSSSRLPKAGNVSTEQREHMIAEAAYYLAEQRGFHDGDPLQDWLDAEKEIDHRLIGIHLHSA